MISIGILTYKRNDLILSTVKDISESNLEIDLIILDNNESKSQLFFDVEKLLRFKDNIKLNYISHQKNYGVSLGRKILIDSAKAKYIILFDDDLYIPKINVIINSVNSVFKSNDDVKGIAFNIIDSKTKCHNRYEIPHKNKNIDMSEPFFTYLLIGAGHALDVEYVKYIGSFADDFGLYGFEEIDLAFRIINSGAVIYYDPNSVVYHKRSPDGRFSNLLVNKQAFINRCLIAKRYFKKRYFLTCLIVRGVFFLIKSKNIFELFNGIKTVLLDDKYGLKFKNTFYDYIKSVKGFIYW